MIDPFYIVLLLTMTAMFTALYLTREDKKKPWHRQLLELFRLKPRSRRVSRRARARTGSPARSRVVARATPRIRATQAPHKAARAKSPAARAAA